MRLEVYVPTFFYTLSFRFVEFFFMGGSMLRVTELRCGMFSCFFVIFFFVFLYVIVYGIAFYIPAVTLVTKTLSLSFVSGFPFVLSRVVD